MIGLHAMQHDQRLTGVPDVDQRLLGAKAEASGLHKLHVEAASLDGMGEGVVDAFRSVAGAACSHANGYARPRGQQLGQPGIAHRSNVLSSQNAGHARGSCLFRASSSSCNVRSFMWPKTA